MNRRRVLDIYRQLYHIGKEYPKGSEWFHSRLKTAFLMNKEEKDPKKVEELVKRAEFVLKEIESMYSLRKYRAMKNRYYEE
ncbi:unnamed protein product [Cylicocyclus nassatus]|uniref:Complex 1 LYR protein domain-containing protein n=1 Tax=Cylicocyclus nassatus TaxID=53992 RepID=A0AA36GJG2_CYLNA|nr:unnamed protein product [Cylicocyclus nassatus]